MIGHRKGGVDTQLADIKIIPNSAAPGTDSTADQIYDAGSGATLKDKGGYRYPLVLGADGNGVVTVTAAMSPYTCTELVRRALVNTTDGAVTILLPESVRVGHDVEIVDDKRQFATNNCTVNGNGVNINGASTYVLSQQDTVAVFKRASSTWETNPAGGGGGAGAFTTLDVSGLAQLVGGLRVKGSTPAVGADAVGFGIADLNGAGTAGLQLRFEAGQDLRIRHMSDSGNSVNVMLYSQTVADDGSITLPVTVAANAIVLVSSGDEAGLFAVGTSAAVVKVAGTTNTDNADTDTKLCVFDGGTAATIRNRLGGSRTILALVIG